MNDKDICYICTLLFSNGQLMQNTLIFDYALTYKTHSTHYNIIDTDYDMIIYSISNLFTYKTSYTLTFTRYWVNWTLKAFKF